MRHPDREGVFYSREKGDWVTEGWTAWPIAEWRGVYGNNRDWTSENGPAAPDTLQPKSQWVDANGRIWEFFGYEIKLYDDEQT